MGSGYRPRIADAELHASLASAGAVVIKGPKACGKTRMAQRRAAFLFMSATASDEPAGERRHFRGRDPQRLGSLLGSLGRNVATEVSLPTLAPHAGGADGPLDPLTKADSLPLSEGVG